MHKGKKNLRTMIKYKSKSVKMFILLLLVYYVKHKLIKGYLNYTTFLLWSRFHI